MATVASVAVSPARERTRRKALRIIEGQGVQHIGPHAFRVLGEHDIYLCITTGEDLGCSCPAAGICSHLLAAAIVDEERSR